MYQRKYKDESDWQDVTEAEARQRLEGYYKSVDIALETLKMGLVLDTPFSLFRWIPDFDLKQYLSSFQDESLCKEWNNNIPLRSLQDEKYTYLDNSQDIESTLEFFGDVVNPSIITGMIVWIGDGEYIEVYVTEASRPYDLSSIYHPFSYYL